MTRKHYVLFTLLLVSSAGVAIFAMLQMLTPYVSFQDAMKSANQVQVMGKIDRSLPLSERNHIIYFSLRDENGEEMKVMYKGKPLPQFSHAEKAVVIGVFHGQSDMFVAEKILLKCPSKYVRETR